jgi:hypothetical protein
VTRTKFSKLQHTLAALPRNPPKWLRPTFLVQRSEPLQPVYIAVLSASEDEATYEVLGSQTSPVTISRESLANLLLTRGTKQG